MAGARDIGRTLVFVYMYMSCLLVARVEGTHYVQEKADVSSYSHNFTCRILLLG